MILLVSRGKIVAERTDFPVFGSFNFSVDVKKKTYVFENVTVI
jgi:hypothetical protein